MLSEIRRCFLPSLKIRLAFSSQSCDGIIFHEIMRGSAETRQETIYVITSSLSSRRRSAEWKCEWKKLSRRKTIYLKYFQIEIAAPSIYKSHQMSRVMYYYQRWWDEIYISIPFIHLAFGCRLCVFITNMCYLFHYVFSCEARSRFANKEIFYCLMKSFWRELCKQGLGRGCSIK